MMKKKAVSILMCGLLVLMTAAGCGTTQAASDVTTITVWTNQTHSKAVYDKLVEKYNNGQGKNDGIRIDYQVKGGDTYNQAIDVALQTGTAPDFFTATGLEKNVQNGYVAALDDMPGGAALIEKYKDISGEKRNVFNGKTYALPISITTTGLLYNKDMFRAAGIVDENGEPTPPETWEEVREYAKRLTNPDKREYGIILPVKWGSAWFSYDLRNRLKSSTGYTYYNPIKDDIDCFGLEPIMEAYVGMKQDKSCFPGEEGIDNDQARALFAEGGIGMKLGVSWDVGVLNDQFPAKIDWGVAPDPVADKNNKYYQLGNYSYGMVINSNSVDKVGADKLMKVFEFLHSDEVLTELYLGGVTIPSDYSIIENASMDNLPKGWKEFADLVKISSPAPLQPPLDISGKKNVQDVFLNDVWAGKVTPREACEAFTEVLKEGRATYKAANPNEDYDIYLMPDYDPKKREANVSAEN